MEIPHGFFLITPGNSTLFLINSWNFTCYFFNTPGNYLSSTPPSCFFSWNSSALSLPTESHPSLTYLFFSCNFGVKLPWSQRRGKSLIPLYLIDIHETVKPSDLEKLQIIQNINKLMFQVIFLFSGWILIKQITFLQPFRSGGRIRFSKKIF